MSLIKRKSIEAVESRKPARSRQAHDDEQDDDTAFNDHQSQSSDDPKPRASRKGYQARYAPVTFSEEFGIRYLHFGTAWVQGAMRIRKPFALELEYAQQMMIWLLWLSEPKHVAQLGLGAAALTKFCWKYLPECQVTAVELNPDVIAAAYSMFKLPYPGTVDDRLQVLQANAMDYVTDPELVGSLDALQVDLYDATARGPVLDSPEFYQGCRDLLKPGGIMTINLFGDHDSYPKNIHRIEKAFGKHNVVSLPEVHQGNVVVIAFHCYNNKHAPLPQSVEDFGLLYERAKAIQLSTGLSTRSWLTALKKVLLTDVKAS